MNTQNHAHPIAHRITRGTLAIVTLLLGACSATTTKQSPTKTASGTERHGQVKFSGGGEQIVGDIAIRHDGKYFYADITKGPGVTLLKLSARFGPDPTIKDENHLRYVRATGPLAHGGWTWRPNDLAKKSATDKLKDASRAWAALPEVFMWGEAQAKGEPFRVCLPDIVMHARVNDGEVKRFDYTRHENPTGEPLPLRDLKKLRASETVVCHLD